MVVSASHRVRQVATVLAALLMVTSMIAPVTATGRTDSTPAPASSLTPAEPTEPPNASATYRLQAYRLLEDGSLPGNGKAAAFRKDLNDSVSAYVGRNRVSRSTFQTDKRIAAQSRNHLPAVTEALLRSDAKLAHVALADAERALAHAKAQNASVDVAAVEADIAAAEKALQKGAKHRQKQTPAAFSFYERSWVHSQAALDRLDAAVEPNVTITSRQDPVHNGTINYTVRGTVQDVRTTDLTNATVAVDGTEYPLQVVPNATPSGKAIFRTTVQVPAEPTTITVSVTDPGTNYAGGQPPQDDPGQGPPEKQTGKKKKSNNGNGKDKPGKGKKGKDKKGNNGNGKDKDKGKHGDEDGDEDEEDQDSQPTDAPAQTATATLRLDGDRLPDVYETTVSKTDPLDPDSDVTATDVDESDNGTRDDFEDADGDGLDTAKERSLGTDPLSTDTDGDGLTDSYELIWTRTDPTKADTDGDGTPDGAEDPDGDGLDNEREQAAGSDPLRADGDRDGWTDAEELQHGTDPLSPDTDADGLLDSVEPTEPFGTDPLDPDTDGDGIQDGNETYTSTARNESVGVTVDTTGTGNVARGVDITRETNPLFQSEQIESMAATPVVDLTSQRNFSSAQITFEYEESELPEGNESQLAVFRYVPEVQGFEPVNSTVDPQNDTVSANTTHFSRYVVFNVANWGESFSATPPDGSQSGGNGTANTTGVDVVFVVDTSGSMSDTNQNGYRYKATEEFVGALIDGDRAGVVEFDSFASVDQSLTTDFDAVNQSVKELGAGGGTNIGAGLKTANQEFTTNSNDSRSKVAIFLTDGKGYGGRPQAEQAADMNITVYTIGFSNANDQKLQDIATTTGGTYTYVQDASDLPDVFSRVAENTTGTKDSDGDGLSDTLETKGFTANGTPVLFENVSTDPKSADTDGDGLPDNEEVGKFIQRNETVTINVGGTLVQKEITGGYYLLNSHPNDTDGDSDGLADSTEVNGWKVYIERRNGEPYKHVPESAAKSSMYVSSDPLNTDTDGDGVSDYIEKTVTKTDPKQKVTYGVTEEHSQRLAALNSETTEIQRIRLRNAMRLPTETVPESPYQSIVRFDTNLTDGSDDFDFVFHDKASSVRGQLVFLALDGTNRTDIWMNGTEEANAGTSAWDPDTDDDGLTDGQEEYWLTELPNKGDLVSIGRDKATVTDPTDADTDGDGYWDGWIGVHGVGHSDNVILYRQHLQSGDGVEGDEIVQEQVGVHDVGPASGDPPVNDPDTPPSNMSVDIDGDKITEHSNVHIGELQWETSPTDESSTPDPTVAIEVDYYAQSHPALRNASWRRAIVDNYALYGVDVTFKGQSDVLKESSQPGGDPPFNPKEINNGIRPRNHDAAATTLYMFVGSEAADVDGTLFDPNLGGVRWNGDSRDDTQYIAVFTNPLVKSTGVIPTNRSDISLGPDEKVQTVSQKTAVHEIGHVLNIGEADEGNNEIYSGSAADSTNETVIDSGTAFNDTVKDWSVMSGGAREAQYLPPSDDDYFAFSIQELFTISTDDANEGVS